MNLSGHKQYHRPQKRNNNSKKTQTILAMTTAKMEQDNYCLHIHFPRLSNCFSLIGIKMSSLLEQCQLFKELEKSIYNLKKTKEKH